MATAMYSAISGLRNHQTWMDVIGNNVSNVNTVGFKYGRVTFKSMFSQSLGAAQGFNAGANLGGVNPTQIGLGMALSSIDTIMAQGALQTTGNPLDVAIVGDGMFMAKSGTSTLFTRAGNFGRDSGGNVVTAGGQLIQGWMGRYSFQNAGVAPNFGQVITGWQAPDPNQALGNLTIPTGLTLAARATTEVRMSGNLDAMTPQHPAWLYFNAGGVPHCTSTLGTITPLNWDSQWKPDAVVSTTTYDSIGNPVRLRTEFYQVAATPTSGGSGAAAFNYYTYVETNQGLVFVGNLWPASPTPPGNVGGIQPNNEPTGFAGQIGFNSDGSVKYNVALDGMDANCSQMASARGVTLGGGLLPPYAVAGGGSTWTPTAGMDQTALQIPLFTLHQPPAGMLGAPGVAPAGITLSPQTGATVSTSPLTIQNWGVGVPPNGNRPSAFGTVSYVNGVNVQLNNGIRDGLTGDVTGTYQIVNGVPTYIPNHTAYIASQNGYPEGTLTGLNVDPLGIIQGGFTNGQTIPLAQIAVIQFANMQGLAGAGNTDFAATVNSGLPIAGTAGQRGTGQIVSGALEQSNVDLAQELTNMIIAQRGFDANSRIITTSSDMLDTLVNLGRR